VINKLKLFSVGAGPAPTGLESLLASHCISRGLADGVGGAAVGAASLRDNAVLLGLGLDKGLDDFRKKVRAGRKQLNAAFGSEKVEGETLLNGIARLDDGAGLVAGGAGAAAAGSKELVGGLGQLADGGGQLAAGAGKAAAGSGDLADGLRQLDEGGYKLAEGAGKASSGSRDLSSGLGQLDDGALKLADGLGDAAEGSTKLADGLVAAEEGGTKIADGTGKLQEGFEEKLIGGVSGARQGASQDHEQVKAVIARGREGASPYGIADGADATTVFQFDLAGVGSEEGGPSAPLLTLFALVALGLAGGLGLMLKRRLVA
jgi:putative membrane protein